VSLPVRLRRVAQAEFDEAADWYEARRWVLGCALSRPSRRCWLISPTTLPRWAVWPGVREAPVEVAVLHHYQTFPDHVMILAIFHASREPTGAAISCLVAL
jgi:hypothetical protein